MAEISIIIPLYNNEKYLSICLESIQKQSFFDFEVLIIDDGSTNNAGKIAEEFAVTDQRFSVIHKQNEGVSVARNVGINNASGKFITMIDRDDYIDVDYLERLYNGYKKTRADIVICNYITKIMNGEVLEILSTNEVDYELKSGIDVLNTFGDYNRVAFYACGKLYSAQVLKKIRYDSTISLCEDALFNCIVYSNPDIKCVFCSQANYYYRIHSKSATHSASLNSLFSKIDAYKKIREIATNYHDSPFWTGINYELLTATLGFIYMYYGRASKEDYNIYSLRDDVHIYFSYINRKNMSLKFRILFLLNCLPIRTTKMFFFILYKMKNRG